jgi:plasmid stabilization system protein ParE
MEIDWDEEAADDLKSIASDNSAAAARVRADILAHVLVLATMPHIGRPGRVADTRELVVGSYVVAYTVSDEVIRILAVLHAARQWPDSF